MRSSVELFQICDADLRALERRPVPHVLFHVEMLQPTLARRPEDTLPIDGAFADFGKRITLKAAGSGLITGLEILDMKQLESPRIAVKVLDRILAAEGCPEAIHLHLHQVRVCRTQQLIVSHHAVINPELEIVIVICELESGIMTLFC